MMEKQLSRNEQSLQTELGASWEARRGEEQKKQEEKLQQREEVGNKEVSMETIQPEVTVRMLNACFPAGEIREEKEVLAFLE